MKISIKTKLKACLWPIIYFLLTIGICVTGCITFHKNYYRPFYVNQSSMNPTLVGDDNYCDYGFSDHHSSAIKLMKRFQIGLVYFPEDYNEQGKLKESASLKIKRLLVMPGERFYIYNYNIYIYDFNKNEWNDPLPIPFDRIITNNRHSYYQDTTLGDDEYFFAGDNCDVSHDCFDNDVNCLNYSNISAVVVEITGKRIKEQDGSYTYKKMSKKYFPGVDY